MKQAGNPFVSTVNHRLDKLETDVTKLKREQCAHTEQIEALAVELHQVNLKIDRIDEKFDYKFGLLDTRIDSLESKLNLIITALATRT